MPTARLIKRCSSLTVSCFCFILNRIKFIDDIDGAYHQVLCSLVSVELSEEEKKERSHHDQRELNVCRERAIFVKAALQLIGSNESDVHLRGYMTAIKDSNAVDSNFEFIRTGYLKKETRAGRSGLSLIGMSGGVIGLHGMGLGSKGTVGASSGFHWKSKFCELKHGLFNYYDEEDTGKENHKNDLLVFVHYVYEVVVCPVANKTQYLHYLRSN